MATRVVILAAGVGKRMYSDLPKVLHPLAGKPLIEHVLQTALTVAPGQPPIVVCGHGATQLRAVLGHYSPVWVEQEKQLGTGDALRQALPVLQDDEQVLVLYGDVPLIAVKTLQRLLSETPREGLGLVTAKLANPSGYGRIQRNAQNQVQAIIEEKESDEQSRQIQEINAGIYCVAASALKQWLPSLSNQNAQGEYYLTDILSLALAEGKKIHTIQPERIEEILGVNDRLQLNQLERFYQRREAEKLMRQGLNLADPARFDLRGELIVGRDVSIDVNVVIEGRVVLADGVKIGPQVYLRNTQVGKATEIKANSVLDGVEVAEHCFVGPFARLRPGTVLAAKVEVGNFIEIKNSYIDLQSKVHHLGYIGDTEIGKRVNIGAGTITCNYDGVNKHQTIIGDDVFVGSGTELVAPVKVGQGAFIGSGSTITQEVPAKELTLARARQLTIEGWQHPAKKKANCTRPLTKNPSPASGRG